MKLINRDTDNAVKALLYLAKNSSRKISVIDLSDELSVSHPFLRKILQIINKEGILQSFKGKGGGFRLNRPPDKISLIEIIRIFQGPVKLNECVFKEKICPDIKTCPLRKRIKLLERSFLKELESITLAGLLKDEGSL